MPKGQITIPKKTYYRGPWTDRFGKHHSGKTITRSAFNIPRRGLSGGRKTLPQIREPGMMTSVAHSMGYTLVTSVPENEIPEFVERLVNKYGQKRASGMLRWQINIRKNQDSHAKRWFETAWSHLAELIAHDHLPGGSKYY